MNSFNRHNCLEHMWENFWNSRIRHAPFCSLSMTSSKRVTQIWEPPVHLHKHDVLKRRGGGVNRRIELLMAHGQRHTATAKQIQQQRENCLQTLHAKTLLPPTRRRSFDGQGPSVPTTLDFPAWRLKWWQGAPSCFQPRKSSALML